jgi:hypothetical protein
LFQHELFRHDRFLGQISVGDLPHRRVLRCDRALRDGGRAGRSRRARGAEEAPGRRRLRTLPPDAPPRGGSPP